MPRYLQRGTGATQGQHRKGYRCIQRGEHRVCKHKRSLASLGRQHSNCPDAFEKQGRPTGSKAYEIAFQQENLASVLVPAPSNARPPHFDLSALPSGITQLPGTYLCSGCVQWCPDRTATPLKSSSVETSVAWRPSTLNEHRDARPRGAEGGGPYTVTRGTLLSRSYKYLRSRQRGQPRQSISQACSTNSQLDNQNHSSSSPCRLWIARLLMPPAHST